MIFIILYFFIAILFCYYLVKLPPKIQNEIDCKEEDCAIIFMSLIWIIFLPLYILIYIKNKNLKNSKY